MIMRCTITEDFFVGIFPNTFQPPKNLLNSMYLSRVCRKSETDKFLINLLWFLILSMDMHPKQDVESLLGRLPLVAI